MKKIIFFVICLIIITGCSKNQELSIDEYYLVYENVDIKLGIRLSTLLASIGNYNDSHSDISSYDDSMTTIYEFDTLEVETYLDNNEEKVYAINITSFEQETNEGIKIGDSIETMTQVYGDEYDMPLDNVYIYNTLNTNVSFTVENGIIVGIRYYLS